MLVGGYGKTTYAIENLSEKKQDNEFLFENINDNDDARIPFWTHQRHLSQQDIWRLVNEKHFGYLKNGKSENQSWAIVDDV